MKQIATAVINRQALRHNLRRLRELAPTSKLIAIVKANAYGHGLLNTALTLSDVDAFGVARLDEALQLREGGIKQPIILLEGFLFAENLSIIASQQFQTTIHNIEQLEALERMKLSKPIIVWMKIDTGMHRLGIRQEQAEEFYRRLILCKNVQKPVNILSHFSRSSDIECEVTRRQIYKFNNFCKGKPGLRSIAASGGILFWPQSHLDWIRPGIILYGILPLAGKLWGANFGFEPVMSFISNLIAVRRHKIGESVGYGGTWISERNTLLGIVAIGYGDGYSCAVPSGTPILVNGRKVITVGHAAMDMVCVDLGPQAKDKAGDQVILWGKDLPVEHIALINGVTTYELITRLTSRVKIHYLN